MNFRPTSRCLRLPPHLNRRDIVKPVPHLSDDDIDTCLQFMIHHGAADMSLPVSQYGRRVAVEAHLRYEAIPGFPVDVQPPYTAHPAQPR